MFWHVMQTVRIPRKLFASHPKFLHHQSMLFPSSLHHPLSPPQAVGIIPTSSRYHLFKKKIAKKTLKEYVALENLAD